MFYSNQSHNPTDGEAYALVCGVLGRRCYHGELPAGTSPSEHHILRRLALDTPGHFYIAIFVLLSGPYRLACSNSGNMSNKDDGLAYGEDGSEQDRVRSPRSSFTDCSANQTSFRACVNMHILRHHSWNMLRTA